MQSKDADCEGSGRARKSKNHICKLQYLWRKSTHKGGGSVVAKGKKKFSIHESKDQYLLQANMVGLYNPYTTNLCYTIV